MYEKVFAYNTSIKSIWNAQKKAMKVNQCFNVYQLIRPYDTTFKYSEYQLFFKPLISREIFEVLFTNYDSAQIRRDLKNNMLLDSDNSLENEQISR